VTFFCAAPHHFPQPLVDKDAELNAEPMAAFDLSRLAGMNWSDPAVFLYAAPMFAKTRIPRRSVVACRWPKIPCYPCRNDELVPSRVRFLESPPD